MCEHNIIMYTLYIIGLFVHMQVSHEVISTPGYMNVELEDKSVPMTDNPRYEHVQRTQLTKPLYGL